MKELRIGGTKGDRFILLKSIEEVRRFVESFRMDMGNVKMIGDLSLLSVEAQSVLLKFIEEGKDDIICYASRDNINPVLMSRFDEVNRFDNFKVGQNIFNMFYREMQNKDKVENESKIFLSLSGDYLGTYLLYKRLSKGVLARVGELL